MSLDDYTRDSTERKDGKSEEIRFAIPGEKDMDVVDSTSPNKEDTGFVKALPLSEGYADGFDRISLADGDCDIIKDVSLE